MQNIIFLLSRFTASVLMGWLGLMVNCVLPVYGHFLISISSLHLDCMVHTPLGLLQDSISEQSMSSCVSNRFSLLRTQTKVKK